MKENFFFLPQKSENSWACAHFTTDEDSRMSEYCECYQSAQQPKLYTLYDHIAFENVDFTPPHFMCFCPLSFRSSIHAISFTYNFSQLEILPSSLSIFSHSLSLALSIFIFPKNTEAPVLLDELVVESRREKFTFQKRDYFFLPSETKKKVYLFGVYVCLLK